MAADAPSEGATGAGDGRDSRYRVEVSEVFEPNCTFESTALRYRRVDLQTGFTEQWQVCLAIPSAGVAALPAVPPSPSEVWGHLPIPPADVSISPPTQGIVGLETWLWYEGDDTLSMTLALPPFWTLTVAADAQAYTWDLGNGDVMHSNRAGSEAEPAALYTYQYACRCAVTTTVTWGGTYTVAGPGIAPFTVDLGTRAFTGEPFAYPVVEVQAVVNG